ncbi:MAG: hypothetical protein LBI61_03080, partial [Puniceicoccales bacterium]|nr:hypothetical protein [Puniceicoccales bacterium]
NNIENAKTAYGKITTVAKNLNEKLEEKTTELKNLKARLEASDNKNSKLEGQIKEKKEEIEKLGKDLQTANTDLEGKKVEIEKLKKEIEAKKEEIVKLEKEWEAAFEAFRGEAMKIAEALGGESVKKIRALIENGSITSIDVIDGVMKAILNGIEEFKEVSEKEKEEALNSLGKKKDAKIREIKKEKNAKIREIKKEKDEEIEEKEEEIAEKEEEIAKKEKEIEKAEEEIRKTESDRSRLSDEIRLVEQKVAESDAAYRAKEEELARAGEGKERAEAQLQKEQENKQKLQEDLRRLNERLEENKAETEKAKREIEGLRLALSNEEEKLVKLSQEVASLKKNLEKGEKDKKKLVCQTEILVQEKRKLKEGLDRAENEKFELRKKLAGKDEELGKLRVDERIAAAEKDLALSNNQLRDLKIKLQEKQRRITVLEQQETSPGGGIRGLLSKAKSKLTGELEKAREEKARLEGNISETEEQKTKTENKLLKLIPNKKLVADLRKVEGNLEETEAKLETAKNRTLAAEEENKKLRKEFEKKEAEVENKNKELEEKNKELKRKNAELKRKNAELEYTNAELKNKLKEQAETGRKILEASKERGGAGYDPILLELLEGELTEEKVEKAEHHIEELRNSLKQTKKKVEFFQKGQEELTRHISKTQQKLKEKDEAISYLNNTNRELSKRSNLLSNEVTALREENETIKKQLDVKNKENAALNLALEEANRDLQKNKKEIEDLKGEIENLQKEIVEINKQHSSELNRIAGVFWDMLSKTNLKDWNTVDELIGKLTILNDQYEYVMSSAGFPNSEYAHEIGETSVNVMGQPVQIRQLGGVIEAIKRKEGNENDIKKVLPALASGISSSNKTEKYRQLKRLESVVTYFNIPYNTPIAIVYDDGDRKTMTPSELKKFINAESEQFEHLEKEEEEPGEELVRENAELKIKTQILSERMQQQQQEFAMQQQQQQQQLSNLYAAGIDELNKVAKVLYDSIAAANLEEWDDIDTLIGKLKAINSQYLAVRSMNGFPGSTYAKAIEEKQITVMGQPVQIGQLGDTIAFLERQDVHNVFAAFDNTIVDVSNPQKGHPQLVKLQKMATGAEIPNLVHIRIKYGNGNIRPTTVGDLAGIVDEARQAAANDWEQQARLQQEQQAQLQQAQQAAAQQAAAQLQQAQQAAAQLQQAQQAAAQQAAATLNGEEEALLNSIVVFNSKERDSSTLESLVPQLKSLNSQYQKIVSNPAFSNSKHAHEIEEKQITVMGQPVQIGQLGGAIAFLERQDVHNVFAAFDNTIVDVSNPQKGYYQLVELQKMVTDAKIPNLVHIRIRYNDGNILPTTVGNLEGIVDEARQAAANDWEQQARLQQEQQAQLQQEQQAQQAAAQQAAAQLQQEQQAQLQQEQQAQLQQAQQAAAQQAEQAKKVANKGIVECLNCLWSPNNANKLNEQYWQNFLNAVAVSYGPVSTNDPSTNLKNSVNTVADLICNSVFEITPHGTQLGNDILTSFKMYTENYFNSNKAPHATDVIREMIQKIANPLGHTPNLAIAPKAISNAIEQFSRSASWPN